MSALFLYYCWRCNLTEIVASREATNICDSCSKEMCCRNAHALIPALGAKLDEGERCDATKVDKAQKCR